MTGPPPPPLVGPRAARALVRSHRRPIRRDLLGGIEPGQRLVSERDLGRFGSRERPARALRALEAQGVIEIRTGSRGGAFVAEPSSISSQARSATFLRFARRPCANWLSSASCSRPRTRARRRAVLDSVAPAEPREHRRRRRGAAGDAARPDDVAALEVSFTMRSSPARRQRVRAAIMGVILDALERSFRAVPAPPGSSSSDSSWHPSRREYDGRHPMRADAEAAPEARPAEIAARWSELEVAHSP